MSAVRIARYARYSSDLQRQTSIDDQLAVARRYADQHGWTTGDEHVFTDAGISGASLAGRPAIQALLSAAAQHPRPFDVLLVDDSSRVARDLPDALHVLRTLKFCGIRTIYISQQIDSDNEQAETLLTVHGLVDGLYLQEMSKKIKRGLAGQLDRGYHTGSRTYGYRTIPELDPGKLDGDGRPAVKGKRLHVDPVQASTIVRIYEWYANGTGVSRIVERLTRDGTPPPRRTHWTATAVRRILANERYTGKQIWGQQRYERRPGTNRRVPRTQPRNAWHVVERPELRIVSDALRDRVMARRARVRASFTVDPGTPNLARGRSAVYSRHLFSGLLCCGVCGGAVCIVSGGMGSPRYGCSRSWRDGRCACDNRITVRATVADRALLGGVQDELLRPKTVAYITTAVSTAVQKSLVERPQAREQLLAERDRVTRKLENLVRAVEDGVALSALQEAITARQADLRRIDDDLARLDDPPPVTLAVIPTWIRDQLQDCAGLLGDAPERAKAEFRRLDMRFTLSPIRDEGRPFLRAEGIGNLDALCGTRDLYLPARQRSLR